MPASSFKRLSAHYQTSQGSTVPLILPYFLHALMWEVFFEMILNVLRNEPFCRLAVCEHACIVVLFISKTECGVPGLRSLQGRVSMAEPESHCRSKRNQGKENYSKSQWERFPLDARIGGGLSLGRHDWLLCHYCCVSPFLMIPLTYSLCSLIRYNTAPPSPTLFWLVCCNYAIIIPLSL